jgi:hypothetical protein
MELRLLTTEAERSAFAQRLSAVRMMRGAGFSETHRSVIGEVHLAFGKLYGLFDDRSANPEMLGGFAMHDLGMFGQSYPKPDLTHLPPESVYECGELWAVAAGAGAVLRHAGGMLAQALEAKALLVYPIMRPWNLTHAYKGFNRIGEPIEGPYARTLDGGKIYVQAMVGDADVLAREVPAMGEYQYELLDNGRRLRFETSLGICSRPIAGRRRETAPQMVPAVVATAARAAA